MAISGGPHPTQEYESHRCRFEPCQHKPCRQESNWIRWLLWIVLLLLGFLIGHSLHAQGIEPPVTAVPTAALTTTPQTVVLKPAILGWYHCTIPSADTVAYVQFFDTAGTVTLGTTSQAFFMGFQAGQSGDARLNINFQVGIQVVATTTATGSGSLATPIDCSWGWR